LVVTAIFLGALFGLTALGIDIARLAHIANEAQTVADAGARAGARALNNAGGIPGSSDPDAHTVAARNVLNGELASAVDVLVDEGFFNGIERNFECCTENSPCCESGTWGGVTCVTGSAGRCAKRGAVLVTARTTTDNLLAGILGAPTTDVEKLAIAAYQGPSSGCSAPAGCAVDDYACWCENNRAPCLPIAVPSCRFPNPCPDSGCDLPFLQVSNSGNDTAAWTGYQLGHNASTIRSFFPNQCHNGFHNDIPGQTVEGFQIDVTNGLNPASDGNVFGATQCVFENRMGCSDTNGDGIFDAGGGTIFSIPVFDMSICTQNPTGVYDVVGFAAISIQNVVIDGSVKRIDLQSISHQETGPIGTSNSFGTGRITLVW